MKYLTVIFLFTLCVIINETQASRILTLYPFGGKSHKNFIIPIAEAVAKKGHEVTMVSGYKTPIKNSRFRDIIVKTSIEEVIKSGLMRSFNVYEHRQHAAGLARVPFRHLELYENYTKILMEDPQIQEIMTQYWDLVIVGAFMNEMTYGIVHKINKPTIMTSAGSLFPWMELTFRNPSHWMYYNGSFFGMADGESIFQRSLEFLITTGYEYYYENKYLPTVRNAALPYFNNDLPDFSEVRKNISLVLTNSHYTIHYARPHLPNIVEVGGIHCRPAGELPDTLSDFIASSGDDGFIFFSLGSIAQGDMMPERIRKEFVKTFSMIPYHVIWKWETETMEGLPPNVMLVKWAPQQDLLGHPKIRAFITHGGGMSMQESVYHAVPRIGFPLFAEQGMNMKTTQNLGIGLIMEILDFKAEDLVEAIVRVTEEESFKKNLKQISEIFRIQYPAPMDTAIYWIEYVIRHNGAKHLQSTALDMPWYQYHLLDVYAFIATVIVGIGIVILLMFKLLIKIVKKCVSCVKGSSVDKKKKKE